MCNLSVSAIVVCVITAGVALGQSTYVKVADEWGTIQPGGARVAANGNRFWNIQGLQSGANASSGTLRFYLEGLVTRLNTDFPGGWQVDNLTLVTEHDDSGFSMPGGISVFHFSKDDVPITNAMDSFFPNPPPDAPPGNFAMLTPSNLVFDDNGMSGGQPVRVLLNDFTTMADLGSVTRVNDYVFATQGDDNLEVLGTPGSIVNPAGAINVSPDYALAFPTANADDSLATFETEISADMGDWIPAGLDTIISDIEDGTDALSFILATTEANSTASATYKGNAFTNRFPPRMYLQVSGTGPSVGVLGDYNDNGTVDAADYVLWRNGGPLENEGNNPGVIDQADYDFWRSRFGAMSGVGGGLTAIPEPTTSILGALTVIVGGLSRRRQLSDL
jgi:hypothetical protein